MGSLEIRMFGVFSLERDGQPVSHFPSHKVKALFAYLLLNRQSPQSRERLASELWGEGTGDRARHCLNTALWRLRSTLRQIGGDHPYLRIDAQQIGVNLTSELWLDITEFEVACERAARATDLAEQARWRRLAVGYYRDDLLVDCYDDWCLVERERLQRLYLRSLDQLLAYHRRMQEYDTAIGYARQILACNPLREPIHRVLIQLYLDSGDQVAALRHFQRCEETFRRDLGADLMPETRALAQRVLRSLPATKAARPAEPAPTSLARLDDAMARVVEAQAQLAAATATLDALRRELTWETAGFGQAEAKVSGDLRWRPTDAAPTDAAPASAVGR